jgi:hypothetical protein
MENQTDTTMNSVLKWVILTANIFVIIGLVGLRQYAFGQHVADVNDAYQGMISRGLLDENKVENYAKEHNGWNPKDRLNSIGNPDGFVQLLFALGTGDCTLNAFAILFFVRQNKNPPNIRQLPPS